MPYRLTKIYTRKGDEGFTTIGEKQISKDDLLIEALGNIDELNSAIGFSVSLKIKDEKILACLRKIQNELFDLGGELYLPDHVAITPENISYLEETLDDWNGSLPPLKEFLLPGGNPPAAACHLARTICRRAERSVVRLHRRSPLKNPELLRYLNRLSDLLFVIARLIAKDEGDVELMWDRG